MDFFSGKRYQGGTTFTAHYAVDATPVFVREGAIIPEQWAAHDHDGVASGVLTVNVYGNGNSRFDLYEDDGISLDYERAPLRADSHDATTSGADHRLVIGPTPGHSPGSGSSGRTSFASMAPGGRDRSR